MKKVIITGGAGFIGSHMCQKMRDEGWYVVAIDRKMPEFELAPAHEYHVFDLRNHIDYFEQFRFQDADCVMQFAAEMGGAEYIFTGENDANIVHSSALINLNVLEACHRAGVKKVFFASSACVYPSLQKTSFGNDIACRESFAGSPDSPYGMEKLFSESAYDAFARNYGMDCKVGRFHNIFGAYGTWRGGREKAPAAFCRKIAEVNAGGNVDCFGDGMQRRSFLHVSEAVEAVSRLMASDFRGPVNIGSSEMVSINMLIIMIATIAGNVVGINNIPGPLGVAARNSDNTLIQEKLGWKPSMSLRAGLELTYPWIADQVEKANAAAKNSALVGSTTPAAGT